MSSTGHNVPQQQNLQQNVYVPPQNVHQMPNSANNTPRRSAYPVSNSGNNISQKTYPHTNAEKNIPPQLYSESNAPRHNVYQTSNSGSNTSQPNMYPMTSSDNNSAWQTAYPVTKSEKNVSHQNMYPMKQLDNSLSQQSPYRGVSHYQGAYGDQNFSSNVSTPQLRKGHGGPSFMQSQGRPSYDLEEETSFQNEKSKMREISLRLYGDHSSRRSLDSNGLSPNTSSISEKSSWQSSQC